MDATPGPVRFGDVDPNDLGPRLCGDLRRLGRALELGIGTHRNSLTLAAHGAKAIALDPDPTRIDDLRRRAGELGLAVECHTGATADLGFATSSSIDLVVADHTLHEVDDLARTLRQVHRVLRSGRPLVLAVPHPFAAVRAADPTTGAVARHYGEGVRTVEEWLTHLWRANFDVDVIREIGADRRHPVPHTLVVRAHTRGD
jgi:SAM-dependent methyltransferase